MTEIAVPELDRGALINADLAFLAALEEHGEGSVRDCLHTAIRAYLWSTCYADVRETYPSQLEVDGMLQQVSSESGVGMGDGS